LIAEIFGFEKILARKIPVSKYFKRRNCRKRKSGNDVRFGIRGVFLEIDLCKKICTGKFSILKNSAAGNFTG